MYAEIEVSPEIVSPPAKIVLFVIFGNARVYGWTWQTYVAALLMASMV